MLGFKNKIEMRKRRQNNNRPINLPQGNNILHILHVHHLTQNCISRAYTIFNNCCVAMYVSSGRMHEHWRKLTYYDWTLLIPLLLLFRIESLPFLAFEFLSQNTQTLMRTGVCILEMYVCTDITIYIYIGRLIIEHPREWLASLANYMFSNIIER